MSTTGLFIHAPQVVIDSFGQLCPQADVLITRMRLATVPVIVFCDTKEQQTQVEAALAASDTEHLRCVTCEEHPLPQAKALLFAARDADIDTFSTWMVAATESALAAAATAGCVAGVYVGDGPCPSLRIPIKQADNLADAPRVMVLEQGQCWHDHT